MLCISMRTLADTALSLCGNSKWITLRTVHSGMKGRQTNGENGQLPSQSGQGINDESALDLQ